MRLQPPSYCLNVVDLLSIDVPTIASMDFQVERDLETKVYEASCYATFVITLPLPAFPAIGVC